jgi:hypothetical protein
MGSTTPWWEGSEGRRSSTTSEPAISAIVIKPNCEVLIDPRFSSDLLLSAEIY